MPDRVFQTFGQPRLSVVIFLSVVSTVRASSTSDSSIDIGATHDGTTSTCFTTHGGDDTPFLALDCSPISLRVTSIGIKTYSSLGKHNICKRKRERHTQAQEYGHNRLVSNTIRLNRHNMWDVCLDCDSIDLIKHYLICCLCQKYILRISIFVLDNLETDVITVVCIT